MSYLKGINQRQVDEHKPIAPTHKHVEEEHTGTPPFLNYMDLVIKASDFVKVYMEAHPNPKLLYHNLSHTERVVAAASEIARHYGLGGKDLFIVLTAAWFHDLGYYDNIASHEQAGAALAEDFLKAHEVDDKTAGAVTAVIMATRIPQSPIDLLGEIVCDADLYHFGTDEFLSLNKLLRKEMEGVHGVKISKEEWADSSIHLLESHHYFTGYCKESLKKKKRANLEKLVDKFREYTKTINPMDELVRGGEEEARASAGDPYDITDKPERGVETLFRIASASSQRLSEQADTKAHILISVNSIIVSVFLTLVVRRIDDYPNLILPIVVLLAVSLTTIVFSILATRPHIPPHIFPENGLDKEQVNLLFFGNFSKMSFDDYSQSMFRVLKNERLLYSSLVRNLYEQGIVLSKKYRMLKTAYNVFMFGFVISVIAFVLASRYFMPE